MKHKQKRKSLKLNVIRWTTQVSR